MPRGPIAAVFVYADGQVGLRDIESWNGEAPRNWRRPILPPLIFAAARRATDVLTVDVEVFEQRGKMFDGRPVYCAAGFDVKEAVFIWFVTKDDVSVKAAFAKALGSMNHFIKTNHPGAIELDAWTGDVPLTLQEKADGLERVHMYKRAMRRLVAVKP